jgi:hypothetical protein
MTAASGQSGARLCISALEEALATSVSQTASTLTKQFTSALLAAGIRVSMDGLGGWLDNVTYRPLTNAIANLPKNLKQPSRAPLTWL